MWPRIARAPGLLFVYGTLRPSTGTVMACRLRAREHHLGPARVRGRLYDLGPYPAMLGPGRAGDWVVGDLYRLRSPRRTLRELDAYENAMPGRGRPEFVRVLRCVHPLRARPRMAWLYLYDRPVAPARRVTAGDYDAVVSGRQ